MRAASATTLAILANANNVPIKRADLYTITLRDGTTVFRWTDADRKFVVDGNTFVTGPIIQRGQTKQTVGINVDSIQLKLSTILSEATSYRLTEASDNRVLETLTDLRILERGVVGTDILGKPLIHQFRNGLFHGAHVLVQKLFLNDWNATIAADDPVDWFEGRISDVACGQISVECVVKSMLELLNTQMPATIFQPGCNRTLYDAGCTLNPATYTFAGTATSIVNRRKFTLSGVAQADGYFALGKVWFTDGANAGQSARSVKSYISGVIELFRDFPYDIENGAGVSARAGCDKLQDTCDTKFSNLDHFEAYPYIPVPETAIEGGGSPGTTGSSGGTGGGTVGSEDTARRAPGTYVV